MFTGLIQDVGTVARLEKRGQNTLLGVRTGMDLSRVAVGDSVNIDGYCQTVVKMEGDVFFVEVSPETLARTTAGELQSGRRVNNEPALRLSDRLGGHLVTGHVDGTGVLEAVEKSPDFRIIAIKADGNILRYCVEKGSIAVDGISLTINRVMTDRFEAGIIPHTLNSTTIGLKKQGDKVNIETDLIGKYVERFLSGKGAGGSKAGENEGDKIDAAFLAKHGFLK